MSRPIRLVVAAACAVLLATICVWPVQAQDATSNGNAKPSQSYTTITDVKVTPLSNGVQITITADGILQYQQTSYEDRSKAVGLTFPDARNGTGKNFFSINRYPVSHIALSTPQGAKNGIGLTMIVNNLTESAYQIASSQDGQGVIVTILSDRTIEGAKHGSTAGDTVTKDGGADTSTQVLFANGLLSLRAVKADVAALIAAIALKTGLSVAVDDAVDRKVSLNLSGVKPEAAVQSIATANGLALSRIGGMYILSEGVPNDLATYRVSGTQSYRMQNTQAATASGLLPNFLYSYVKVNPEQNAVVVTAPSQMLAKIGRDLAAVDTPSPEIAIEAVAVEFTDDIDESIGLLLNDQRTSSVTTVNPALGQIGYYNSVGLLPENFQLTLQALVQSGKARVRARPRMSVVNGKPANIFIGAQQFIVTQFNSYGQTQTRIQPVDVGVKLAITPLTGGNGEITTTIAPEVSTITEQDPTTGLPVLSTRNASTTVRVRDGETIVIGGLTLDQLETAHQKVPLLGDLPLLGKIFQSETKNSVRTELVVFVTPRVVTRGVADKATSSAGAALVGEDRTK